MWPLDSIWKGTMAGLSAFSAARAGRAAAAITRAAPMRRAVMLQALLQAKADFLGLAAALHRELDAHPALQLARQAEHVLSIDDAAALDVRYPIAGLQSCLAGRALLEHAHDLGIVGPLLQ